MSKKAAKESLNCEFLFRDPIIGNAGDIEFIFQYENDWLRFKNIHLPYAGSRALILTCIGTVYGGRDPYTDHIYENYTVKLFGYKRTKVGIHFKAYIASQKISFFLRYDQCSCFMSKYPRY